MCPLRVLLVCYAHITDIVARNSPFTERNSSQLSIKPTTPAKSILATKRYVEVIELEDLKQESCTTAPARKTLERSYTIEVAPVILNSQAQASAGHDYDELMLKNATRTRRGHSTLIREHDYEEPVSPKTPVARNGSASAYEEPVPGNWKRLSVPSLSDNSFLAPLIMARRNSSASELFNSGRQSKNSRAKPGMILHYAEFSLIPSQNQPRTYGAAGDLACDRSATSAPSTQHEYEELPLLPQCTIIRPPYHRPIPAPIRLLKGVSAYEVPITKSPLQPKPSPPTVLLSKMKLKLGNLSAGISGNVDDDEERLIESETESRDTNSEYLKSPGNDTLSSQDGNNVRHINKTH